jgi:dolichol-phosphate mannosyltransferase
LEAVPEPVEVIVVDDDSPDETWRVVEEMRDPRVKVIRRVGARGLASAINRGLIESRGELIGWMDADMSMPPSTLPLLIERAKSFDIAIGSRYLPGGGDYRPAFRVLASRLINRLATLMLGFGILDYDSGFVILHRRVFDRVTLMPTGYGSYFMEFMYACRRKGLTVSEVPYVFSDRRVGVSKSAPTLWQFLTTGVGYLTRLVVARLRKLD